MRFRPRRLNTTVALLFATGSAGFVLGSIPLYASAVGTTADALTFFISSIFFTAASFGQLAQAASPAMTPAGRTHDDQRQPARVLTWLPHDRSWVAAATQFPGTLFFNMSTGWAMLQRVTAEQYDRVVWRPDFFGSVLFLVSSTFAILAVGRFLTWRPGEAGWRIAWLNMVGSIAFMASAIGAYVLPKTNAEISPAWANGGTIVGAICFLVGALLMIPAWGGGTGAAPSEEAPT